MNVEVGEEVVDGLREDARPVDRVHCTEPVSCVELSMAKKRFDDVLGAGGANHEFIEGHAAEQNGRLT